MKILAISAGGVVTEVDVTFPTDLDLLLVADLPPQPGTTYDLTRTAGRVTQERWKRTAGLTTLKTIDYTYSGVFVATEVRKVYDAAGTTVLAQTTTTYSYSGALLTGAVTTRDI